MKKSELTMKRLRLLVFPLLVLAVGIFWLVASPLCPQDKPEKHILILNSYHPGFNWTDQEMEGILETLRQAHPHIDPLVEYLDLRRFPQEDNLKSLFHLYQHRYVQKQVEVVIANDNEALEFALKYRSALFPEAAVVFWGVNDFREEMIAGHPRVTGVVEKVDAGGTIDLALRLPPKTQSLVVIADASEEAQDAVKINQGVEPRFAQRVNFRFLVGLNIQEVLQEGDRLAPDSLILLAYFTRD